MYCSTCRYPVRDAPEQRCPECGRSFDARDARTYLCHASALKPAATRSLVLLVFLPISLLFLIGAAATILLILLAAFDALVAEI